MTIVHQNDRSIHYRTQGEGPPLVVLHGLFQSGASWTADGYTERLAREFTVIEIDSLGHGRSSHPREASAYRADLRAGDVVAVLDALRVPRAPLWGFSMGAWIGFAVARYAPQRLTALILGGQDPVGGLRTAERAAAEQYKLPMDSDWFALFLRASRSNPRIAPIVDAGDIEAFRCAFEVLEQEIGFESALAAARVPIQIYCGSKDPYHDTLKAIAATIRARFDTIPDADHFGSWFAVDTVLPRVLEFLAASRR